MNTKSSKLFFLGLALPGLLVACSGGDLNVSTEGPTFPLGSSGFIHLSGVSFDVREGQTANIFVTRSGGNSGVASVNYAVTDGLAVSGSDYTVSPALTGTITFGNQQSGNQTISIHAIADNTAEGAESLTLTLSNVSGATLGSNSSATINIIDNETAAVSAFGPVTELDSVTVNGIRYDTNATNVNINGLPTTASDLKLGQLVAIEGEVNFSNSRGTANQIGYVATVIGPVENIDATLDRLLVMGQTVLTNADTVFGAGIDPATFAGLAIGATTQISGFVNADGDIIATRVEPDTTSVGVQLVGPVAEPDFANMLFSINRLTVDYSSAMLIDLPAGMPTEGLLVIVRGSLINGVLLVNEITTMFDAASTPGERVHVGGVITRFASATDFDLNGFPITTDANTAFVKGIAGDLEANVEITIVGEIGSGGGAVEANEVTIGRPLDDTSTDTFDFENFTNISVRGLSKVIVEQGSNFSVEVTGPSLGNVQVTQNGDTVTFGDNGTVFLDASVTMPVLNRIDVETGSIANVTLRDFNQMQMTVNVGGVSLLRGKGLQVGDLTASVSGVSLLDFGGIRPIGNANIDVNGVSQATLNMQLGSTMAGSVRTGQGTGNSILFYYGTDLTNNVTTDSLSRVTRLGETRP